MSKIEKCGGVTLKTEIVEDDRPALSREVCFLNIFFLLILFNGAFVKNEIFMFEFCYS